QITVTNTGTTTIGTFWFGWEPGEDFLPSAPLSTSSPTGWNPTLTGAGNSFDGTAIEWVATSPGVFLQPGQSSSAFGFTSHDSLAKLAGNSPTSPATPAMTSLVYIGAPELDPGFQLVVSEAPATPPPPSKTATTTALS